MLCGKKWFQKHKEDITQEDIDKLGIVIFVGRKKLCKIRQDGKKGQVKAVIKVQSH